MKNNTIREKVKVPKVPSIYIDYEYNNAVDLIGVTISKPTQFDNTTLGDLIDAVNASLALNIDIITNSRESSIRKIKSPRFIQWYRRVFSRIRKYWKT